MGPRGVRCGTVVACLLAGSVLTGWAQSWKAPVDGSWGVAGNWLGDAVPDGSALVAFTNSHAGAVTVTLDGDRTQTGGMTFGGGDWLVTPGTPTDSALMFAPSTITTLDGVTTLAATGSGGTTDRVSFQGEGEFRIAAPRVFYFLGVNSGTFRVTDTGAVTSYGGAEIYVDGTGRFILDGGTINTRLIRLGQDVFPTNSLFRMTSGTVNIGGYGDTSLLIGYRSTDNWWEGNCTAEILGGTYSATGAVANSHVFIGARNHGTLRVGGTEIPAVLNCGNIWFGWKDTSSRETTNLFVIAENGTVNAAGIVAPWNARPTSTLRVETGGVLRTETIRGTGAGLLDVAFAGGRVELAGVPNTVFSGAGVLVSMLADSELDIDANNVAAPAPFAGDAWLAKSGTGTLALTGDLSDWSGGVTVAQGGLTLGDVPVHTAFGVALEEGTELDLTERNALPLLEVSGTAAVTLDAVGLSVEALTIHDGVCMFMGDVPITVTELHVPDGVMAEIVAEGYVNIVSITGSGALIVSGGGTFNVIDTESFSGSAIAAQDGSVLEMNATFIESMKIVSDTVINTAWQTLTIGTLTLSGGTLSASGHGEVIIENLLVDGVATLVAEGVGAITNISSLALAQDAALTAETAGTVYFGTVQGEGTLRLVGGVADIAVLEPGVSFDIADGEVLATPVSSSASVPAWTSGEPAFWVDASVSASLTTVGDGLEWSDWRGGAYTMKATSANVVPTVVSEPSLGGLSAVKFASPHTNGLQKGMPWNQRLTDVRTVFWVVGAQEGGGQLLGDTSHIDFLRGECPPGRAEASDRLDWPKGIHYAPLISQVYANNKRDHIPCISDGLTRIDGTVVNPLQSGFPNPGYHVVSMRATNNVCAAAFAAERIGQNSERSGCQRLAECLVFTTALTDEEIAATEEYLQTKWFGAGVRARRVRIGGADARFTVRNGEMLLDELHVDVEGLQPTQVVTGVVRVEQLTLSHALSLAYNAATESLPLDIQAVRVENEAKVTIVAPSQAAVWLGEISGDGTVEVSDGTSLTVGSAISRDGEILTFGKGSGAVPVTVRSWLGKGAFQIANASLIELQYADISGNARLTVLDGTDVPLNMLIIRATGTWTLEGSIDPFVNFVYFYGDRQTLTLDLGGNDLRINTFYGRHTLVWHGPDKIRIVSTLHATNSNNPILPADAFVSDIPTILFGTGTRSLEFTGSGTFNIGQFIVEGDAGMTSSLTFAPGVSMTVASFQHRPSSNASLILPQAGTLTIDSLLMRGECAIYFPPGKITTVRTLSTQTTGTGRIIVRDGTLRITETINTCRNFTVIGEGIIFPDNTVLEPTRWDVRTAARFELGEGSAFTFNIADQTNAYAMAFAGGTLVINTDTVFSDALHLEGTALTVASGKTLTAASLTGHDTVTLAQDAVLAVADFHGFDGTIVNDGGTLAIDNFRTNTIPLEPVMAPAFWVDASQDGAFQTNASGKLVWLDKRTARDNASGLMYATALSNSTPPILQGELNGLPVVDFGPLGTSSRDERGMVWNQRITNVQAVHWVIGAQNGGGQLLGDISSGGDIDWFRYSDSNSNPSPNYRFGNAGDDYRTPILPSPDRWGNRANRMAYIHDGTAYLNGVQTEGLGVSNGYPSAGYHLVSVRTTGPTYASAFASERVGSTYGTRSGAQRLGEVLVYSTPLTAEQNRDNDAYLSWKWFARRLDGYRVDDEDLIVLRGSGIVTGIGVAAREIAPAPMGMSVNGTLYLDAYPTAAEIGAVIRLQTLPAPGVSAVSVSGDVFLPPLVTIVLEEVRSGTFTVLATDGVFHGSPEWRVDTSAAPNAYQIKVVQRDDAVILTVTAKGTMILLK